MPTIKNASDINESQAQQTQVTQQPSEQSEPPKSDALVKGLIARYPYKDYGMVEDKRDGSLVVTFPNGMKIRMQGNTIEYYSQVAGGDIDGKEDYTPIAQKIQAALDSNDLKERTMKLKEIVRAMAATEFKIEKYSFVSYLLGQTKMQVDTIRTIYSAFATENPNSLSQPDKAVYEKALSYTLMYYKFLIGLLTVIS